MKKEFKCGFGFIEILLVLAVIFSLFIVSNLYFRKTVTMDKETEKTITEQGVNTTSYKTIIDTTKGKVSDYNTKIEEQNKELENIEK